MSKPSFLLYKSFYEPVKDLSNEELGILFRLVFAYQINPENPVGFLETQENQDEKVVKIPPSVKMAFSFFKNQFDLDLKKYDKIIERNKSNGSKGGRPKKEETQENPENPVGLKEPKKPDKEKEKENVKDLSIIINNNTRAIFKKPTIEEVQNYCMGRKNNVVASKFCNFYESKGWKVGKNSMKDWKAAVRNWESSDTSTKKVNDEELKRQRIREHYQQNNGE